MITWILGAIVAIYGVYMAVKAETPQPLLGFVVVVVGVSLPWIYNLLETALKKWK
jgi:hypothetical protein